jgi:hypothetical protein
VGVSVTVGVGVSVFVAVEVGSSVMMLTVTGVLRFVVVPSPSSPSKFCPQQYATLLLVTAHVCP